MCDDSQSPAPRRYADVLFLEYEQLKEEQRLRIASRDNLLYATLVAVGAICGAAFQARSPAVLLLLPAVCTVLGWTYLSNDRKISQIGRHISGTLATQVSSNISATSDPFAWEMAHRAESGYRLQKIIQMVITLLTFCGPGLLAIVANLAFAPVSPLAVLLMVTGAVGLALLAQQVMTNGRRDARLSS